MSDNATIKQIDRIAAASCCFVKSLSFGIIAGERDSHPLVQAFAAHREAAEKSAAEMREALEAAEQLYMTGLLNTPADEVERVHTLRRAALSQTGEQA